MSGQIDSNQKLWRQWGPFLGVTFFGLAVVAFAASASPDNQPTVIQPPLPESRQNAIANISPVAGKVNVRLQNDTNTQIFYQAVGYTDRRLLAGGNEVILRNLPTPVTITVTRQDDGLLKVIPLPSAQPGLLSVSLDEDTNFGSNQGTLRIQRSGQVFLN